MKKCIGWIKKRNISNWPTNEDVDVDNKTFFIKEKLVDCLSSLIVDELNALLMFYNELKLGSVESKVRSIGA